MQKCQSNHSLNEVLSSTAERAILNLGDTTSNLKGLSLTTDENSRMTEHAVTSIRDTLSEDSETLSEVDSELREINTRLSDPESPINHCRSFTSSKHPSRPDTPIPSNDIDPPTHQINMDEWISELPPPIIELRARFIDPERSDTKEESAIANTTKPTPRSTTTTSTPTDKIALLNAFIQRHGGQTYQTEQQATKIASILISAPDPQKAIKNYESKHTEMMSQFNAYGSYDQQCHYEEVLAKLVSGTNPHAVEDFRDGIGRSKSATTFEQQRLYDLTDAAIIAYS